MGLFSDRCEALIDVTTKRALQGDALAHARQNPDTPQCGNRVCRCAVIRGGGSGTETSWFVEEDSGIREDSVVALAS